MSQYIRYEDVPVVIGSLGNAPEFIFGRGVSLNLDQSLATKRFLDDHVLGFTSTGDVNFAAGEIKQLLLGSPYGPALPLPSSMEKLESGTLISFPTGNQLYINSGASPGDHYVEVRAEKNLTLSFDEDLQNGEIEVTRAYSTPSPIGGNLNVNFFINTGTLQSFFNLTGLLSEDSYPRVNEARITGFFGNFFFDNAYLEALSFSVRAFSPYMAQASIKVFGALRYDENNIDNFYNSPNFNRQKTLPHAVGTEISGIEGVGMDSLTSFNYSISCERGYDFEIPTGGNADLKGEVPVRASKKNTEIECSLEGNNLNPYLKLSGERAQITVLVKDMGFKGFPDESFGTLSQFSIYGVVEKNSLSVADGEHLQGAVNVRQSYR